MYFVFNNFIFLDFFGLKAVRALFLPTLFSPRFDSRRVATTRYVAFRFVSSRHTSPLFVSGFTNGHSVQPARVKKNNYNHNNDDDGTRLTCMSDRFSVVPRRVVDDGRRKGDTKKNLKNTRAEQNPRPSVDGAADKPSGVRV